VGTCLDLLDLRAESHIALGKLDLAAADAAAMVRLAAAAKSQALMAQALNRKAIVQMRQGEMKPALETAVAAAKAARQSRQKRLLCGEPVDSGRSGNSIGELRSRP
jgi:DNA-binding XRE family transcriptional regulator